MMKNNNVSRKLVSMLVVALFMLSFAGLAVSQEPQGTKVEKVTGIISAISPDGGKMSISDASGRGITLTAGSDVDLKGFSAGNQVVVEYTSDMVIKSITKQKSKK